MKSTISREEYHQLLGLMFLHQQHDAAQNEIVRAGNSILGDTEEPFHGSHFADECYTHGGSVDGLLRRHGITVVEK